MKTGTYFFYNSGQLSPSELSRKASTDVRTGRRVFVLEFENHSFGEVFRTLLVAMTGLVLARVVDPVTAQQVIGMITGMGI